MRPKEVHAAALRLVALEEYVQDQLPDARADVVRERIRDVTAQQRAARVGAEPGLERVQPPGVGQAVVVG